MKINYNRKSLNQIRLLPSKVRENIKQRISLLPTGDVKKLQNHQHDYRLRVGKYRVLFNIENNQIYVGRVKIRGDVY